MAMASPRPAGPALGLCLCLCAVLTAALPRNVTVSNNDKYEVVDDSGGPAGAADTEIGNRAGALGQAAQAVGSAFVAKGKCILCVAATALIQDKVKKGATEEEVAATLAEQCKLYRVQEPAVCDGVIKLFAPEVVYILNHTSLGAAEICSYAFTDDCGDEFDKRHDWQVALPEGPKPPVRPERTPKAGAPRLKLLQLSDTHVDPYYLEGALADCELPLCCRATSGPAQPGKRVAGKWGDYGRCDAPVALLENTLQHIAKTHPDLDGILWTGDLQPHDIWNQTREESLSILRLTTDMILKAFPGVPVFPALGNHEAVPVNSFSPSSVRGRLSMSWLYDEVATQWSHWLPANQTGLVRRGAFFSALFKPGLRVVSVNTNFCNDKNWWLLLNSDDPDQELHWLVEELDKAEKAGEKVLVVGHIPPGSPECRSVWSRNLDNILNRYESTVSGLFFGHNHWDEFQLFFDRTDPDKLRPYAVAYVSPSVTPYEKPNPAYRIYYLDGEHPDTTYTVVDHDTWAMDLKAANREGSPEWMRLYSARQAYSMPSLTPASWTRVVRDMAVNDNLFDTFYKNYYRDSAERDACDNQCRRKILCQLLQGRSRDTAPCQVCLGGWFEGKPGRFGNRWVGRPLIGIAKNTAHEALVALGLSKSKEASFYASHSPKDENLDHMFLVINSKVKQIFKLILPLEVSGANVPEVSEKATTVAPTQVPIVSSSSPPPSSSSDSSKPGMASFGTLLALSYAWSFVRRL